MSAAHKRDEGEDGRIEREGGGARGTRGMREVRKGGAGAEGKAGCNRGAHSGAGCCAEQVVSGRTVLGTGSGRPEGQVHTEHAVHSILHTAFCTQHFAHSILHTACSARGMCCPLGPPEVWTACATRRERAVWWSRPGHARGVWWPGPSRALCLWTWRPCVRNRKHLPAVWGSARPAAQGAHSARGFWGGGCHVPQQRQQQIRGEGVRMLCVQRHSYSCARTAPLRHAHRCACGATATPSALTRCVCA